MSLEALQRGNLTSQSKKLLDGGTLGFSRMEKMRLARRIISHCLEWNFMEASKVYAKNLVSLSLVWQYTFQ